MLRHYANRNASRGLALSVTVVNAVPSEGSPMSSFKGSVGFVSFVVLIGVVGLSSRAAWAQADPHSATWVLNVAKSTYTPGPPPREQTSVFTVSGQTLKAATKGISADGKPTSTDYTASFDGKDHPVKGNPDWDAVSIRRVDSHTIEFTRKRAGKVVQTATSVVSKDGATRTITATGVNAQGQKIQTTGVYDKK
jgi:hypothetical protein